MSQKREKHGDFISPQQLPATLFEAAQIKQQQGDTASAAELYKKVIKDDPYHLPAYGKLAFIYISQNRYDLAIKQFKTALYFQPHHFVLINNLAGTYYQANKKRKAHAIYKQCLKLQPNSQLIKKQLNKIEKELQ